MITRRRITQVVNLGILGYRNVEFEVLYSPGAPESGGFVGHPEAYDPGCASEIDILKATLKGIDITSLVERNSAIYDDIIDELDKDALADRQDLG